MKSSFVPGMLSVLAAGLLFTSCAATSGITPVASLDPVRYAGTWYEIARIDFVFERNLDNTSAQYTVRSDGKIEVLNQGYDNTSGRRKQAAGIARFRTPEKDGRLEVSFFGPFYGQYNVIACSPDYQYALVAGKNTRYLWILSRTTTIPDTVKNDFLSQAQQAGYDTGKLIWVRHSR
jgi:apolipoprotein D and lipocalin family protein